METQQKSNHPMKNIDPIEEIWKNNPKIPFMQSKEILALGYKFGKESIQEINHNVQKEDTSKGFAGTTKETIEYAQKKINKKNNTNKSSSNTLDIEESKYRLLNNLVEYIENHQDLIEIYSRIKHLREDSRKKINELKK